MNILCNWHPGQETECCQPPEELLFVPHPNHNPSLSSKVSTILVFTVITSLYFNSLITQMCISRQYCLIWQKYLKCIREEWLNKLKYIHTMSIKVIKIMFMDNFQWCKRFMIMFVEKSRTQPPYSDNYVKLKCIESKRKRYKTTKC